MHMYAAGVNSLSAFVQVNGRQLQLLAESVELFVLLSFFQHVGANPTTSSVQTTAHVFTSLNPTDHADNA